MQTFKDHRPSVAIFCKVVDNFGDIGICWRLGKQLQLEHHMAVTLWVDNLNSFQRLCPGIDTAAEVQSQAGLVVRHWGDLDPIFLVEDIAEIVIEFFGCDIPSGYIATMAVCNPRPVWLNLEGLSAEQWVEGCHTLSSPHPRLPLTKYFFFPGFTGKTGGLLHEVSLLEERRKWQSEPMAVAVFLAQVGVTRQELASFKISLFCYAHAPVAQLFDAWQRGSESIACLVPENVAVQAVQAFLGGDARAGQARTRGSLTVRVLPFVSQPDYDRILWACDLNFVRGEDSFVRAQWAGKPFVWHIYPQEKNLHHVKLRAFLERYGVITESWRATILRWNDVPVVDDDSSDITDVFGKRMQTQSRQSGIGLAEAGQEDPLPDQCWMTLWAHLRADLPALGIAAAKWHRQVLAHGDLASNLLTFAALLRSNAEKTTV
ncbi:MAG: hypothetical protein NVSMB6_23510 [Burkholderiaceae bacterium]